MLQVSLSNSTGDQKVFHELSPSKIGEWDPGPILGHLDRRWSYKNLESDLRQTVRLCEARSVDLRGLCGEDVSCLVADLRELFVVEEIRATRLRDSQKYTDVYRSIRPRTTACLYRLYRHKIALVEPLVNDIKASSTLLEPTRDSLKNTGLKARLRVQLRNACICLGASFGGIITLYQTLRSYGPLEHLCSVGG